MNFDTVLKNIAITALFAALLVPLVVFNGFFFPFITGKNFLFRILVEIAFAAYLLLALRSPQYRPRFSLILGAFGAFLFVMGVATLFAENPWKSFWSNFERMEGYVTLLHLGAYFLALTSILSTEKLWNRFWATSVGVSAVIGLYGVCQLAGWIVINQGGVRLDATLGNAAYLAVYMLLSIGIAVFLLARAKVFSWSFWAYIAAIVLDLIILYYTATRGALLGLLFGALVAAAIIAVFGKEYQTVRKVSVGLLVAVVVLVGGFFAVKNTSFVQNSPTLSRFASISLEGSNARFEIWNLAWQGFKEKPILGWGQENFNYVFNKYYTPGLWSQEAWFDRAHNVFLDWLIAGGVLGLLGYISLYAALIWLFWRGPLPLVEKAIFTGLLGAYFINNLFVFDNLASYLLFIPLLAYAHFLSARPMEWKIPTEASKQALTRVALPVVVLVFVAIFYFGTVRNMIAANDVLNGTVLASQPGAADQSLTWFKKAVQDYSFAYQEINEQLMQSAIRVASTNASLATKQAFYTLAKDSLENEIQGEPSDARLRVFLGSFFRVFGQNKDAVTELTKAHELSPGKQTILFELAFAKLADGDKEGALADAKAAFDSDPTFVTARSVYAAISLYAEKPEIANKILTEKYGTVVVDDDLLLRAYYETKQFPIVVEIWKQRVTKNPSDGNLWLSLGVALWTAADKTHAIEALTEAGNRTPAIKTQADGFIQDIRAGKQPS